jgi:hypothetical protein
MQENSTKDTVKEAFNAFAKESGNLIKVLGSAVNRSVSDLSHTVIVRFDEDVCRHLDILVDAELVKNRAEAARMLISQGIKAKAETFNKIEQTNEEIVSLRGQLTTLIRQTKPAESI